MSVAEKYIVNTYLNLFDGLNSINKIELLEKLVKSLKKEKKENNKEFFKSFGAFGSKKSAQEITKELKGSREFVPKNFKIYVN